MMKKIILIVITLVLSVALLSCGNKRRCFKSGINIIRKSNKVSFLFDVIGAKV